jgi:hypothetical protein
MPNAKSPTNHIKSTPQTINSDNAELLDQYEDEQEDIRGNGATDKFSNDRPGKFEEQDRDGGGGKSGKVEDVGGRIGA